MDKNESALPNRDRIRSVNDNLRATFAGGKVVMTEGVADLPLHTQSRLIWAVQGFDAFNADNDPHRQHDFGGIEIDSQKYFWKIDYYAPDMQGGSEDPSDPEKTTRVLTIMRVDEY